MAIQVIHDIELAMTEEHFQQMVIDFRKDYFKKIDFDKKLAKHRQPVIFLNEKLQELYNYMNRIARSDTMRVSYGNTIENMQGTIEELWVADNRLRSLFNAVCMYSDLRNRELVMVATAIAEYRALYRVKRLIIRKQQQLTKQTEMKKVTPKHFDLEARTTFDKPYLKVFFRNNGAYEKVAEHLRTLESVSKVNVTQQNSGKTDITIYPAKVYDISEVQAEVDISLKNYFASNPNDPVFKKEPISSISDKAYEDIINHILRLGKNFESQQVKSDEEDYRDHFVSYLNALSENYGSKGEVFNRGGKTDILVFDGDGNNTFIAECKMWKGKAYLLEAVEQLMARYINWRDEKTAIIIFNRDHKNFTDLIETAVAAVTSHPLCQKSLGLRKDSSYSFLFENRNDPKKIIKLELILFNFT